MGQRRVHYLVPSTRLTAHVDFHGVVETRARPWKKRPWVERSAPVYSSVVRPWRWGGQRMNVRVGVEVLCFPLFRVVACGCCCRCSSSSPRVARRFCVGIHAEGPCINLAIHLVLFTGPGRVSQACPALGVWVQAQAGPLCMPHPSHLSFLFPPPLPHETGRDGAQAQPCAARPYSSRRSCWPCWSRLSGQ